MASKIKFPYKYKLKVPIDNGEPQKLKELIIPQKPTWGAMKHFPVNPKIGDIQILISNLTNEPLAVIEKLDMKDGNEMYDLVSNFL